MTLSRRRFLHLVATAAALPAFSRCARAQAYPARPVRVLEGFGSGSSADLAARLIGHWLSERLGQHFVIENRPGAGSNVATVPLYVQPRTATRFLPALLRTRSMRRSTRS